MSNATVLMLPFACAVVAGLVAFLLIIWAPKLAMIDVPNKRSSHQQPTPRGGGIGVVVAVLAAIAVLFAFDQISGGIASAFVAGGLVGFVGFIDDRVGLSATRRLLVQVGAAMIAVACVFNWFPAGTMGAMSWSALDWRALLAVVAIVWATNLFNFMDGIDGIAGSEAVFFGIAGAALGWMDQIPDGLEIIWLCLAASSLGFLLFNWPPAKIFMGDVGSGFLGFAAATLAIVTSRASHIPVETWIILGGAFLVDASVTLLRRLLRGDRWYAAHRIHAYQHLSRRWCSHLRVTLASIAVNVLWLFPWAWYAAAHPSRALTCMVAAIVPLVVLVLMSGAGAIEE